MAKQILKMEHQTQKEVEHSSDQDEAVDTERIGSCGRKSRTGIKRAKQDDDKDEFVKIKRNKKTKHQDKTFHLKSTEQNKDHCEAAEAELKEFDQTDSRNKSDVQNDDKNSDSEDDIDPDEIDKIVEETQHEQDFDLGKYSRIIVSGTDKTAGYRLRDIIPRGDVPYPRPPPAPAPPPPDLLDQQNPGFLC